jgi:hypothetical protein
VQVSDTGLVEGRRRVNAGLRSIAQRDVDLRSVAERHML